MTIKSGTKQLVAVALATVWLASIVGASVPLGETTAFSTLRSPLHPASDQYTPLLGSPRYYPQDDYGQDWMNDEPSRIKVANRYGNSDRDQTPITESDSSPLTKKSPFKEYFNKIRTIEESKGENKPASGNFDKESMRLSSIKVAFDDPIIDSELSLSEEDESIGKSGTEEVEEEEEEDEESDDDFMQRDEFVSDNTFEDEGPGSVEVYKLDLYKDKSILTPSQSRKINQRTKSKLPKKVVGIPTADQIYWKTQSNHNNDNEQSRKYLPKIITRFDNHHSDESSSSSSSSSKHLKERIFGVGGVPELQVGCEGVEAFQRQKRSGSTAKSDDQSKTTNNYGSSSSTSAGTQLYIDADYESDEDYSDAVGVTDELFKILNTASNPTESSLTNKNRGDMDPRVKTPADIAAAKARRKDKLPTRGDLGPEGDPNLNDGIQQEKEKGDDNNNNNSKRKLLSLENDVRNKRSTIADEDREIIVKKRRGGDRLSRRNRRERIKRLQRVGENENNEIVRRRNHHSVGRTRGDRFRGGERKNHHHGRSNRVHVRGERRRKNHNNPSNLLRQLPANGRRNKDEDRKLDDEKLSTRERNRKKAEDYRMRNTPIRKPANVLEHKKPREEYVSRETHDRYFEQKNPLQENTNRAEYDREIRERAQNDERERKVTERPKYQPKSPEEIARLKALPVSAKIIIVEDKPGNFTPNIENRFSDNEVSYQGLNPTISGREIPQFPAPSTSRPTKGPSPCVWAVISCCENPNRLPSCFETKGCTGAHWDPDPCSAKNVEAAFQMVHKYTRG